MKGKKSHDNLIKIFKLFDNRPYHLAQFLIENNALTEDFLKKLNENEKLSKFSSLENQASLHFDNIEEMKKYYNSLIEDIDKKDSEEISKELNKKLKEAIDNEEYEKACQIRDYMFYNKIKKQ